LGQTIVHEQHKRPQAVGPSLPNLQLKIRSSLQPETANTADHGFIFIFFCNLKAQLDTRMACSVKYCRRAYKQKVITRLTWPGKMWKATHRKGCKLCTHIVCRTTNLLPGFVGIEECSIAARPRAYFLFYWAKWNSKNVKRTYSPHQLHHNHCSSWRKRRVFY